MEKKINKHDNILLGKSGLAGFKRDREWKGNFTQIVDSVKEIYFKLAIRVVYLSFCGDSEGIRKLSVVVK